MCIAIPDCPRENDSTFWEIEWNTTKAGDTAKQNCPDSSERYGKINYIVYVYYYNMIHILCSSKKLSPE